MAETTAGRRCSKIDTCEPFRMFALRGSLALWASYCEGDYERCARYRLSLTRRPVPDTLLPNGRQINVALV